MGSRTFYEGWDSNRPNIILYINIGVGSQAKKFVLQSVGRGIRIEPVKNERKRIHNLFLARKISQENYQKIKNLFLPLETLFIFGTNASALKETINTFKEIKGEEVSIGSYFEINKKAEILPLFVPKYILAEEKDIDLPEYRLNLKDFNLVKNYYECLSDDRIVLMNYDTQPKVLKKIRESFSQPEKYYKFEKDLMVVNKPDLILSKIINHFSLVPEKFDHFEKVEKGKFIVHFEKIKFNLERKNLYEFLKNLETVKNYEIKEEKIKELQLDYENGKITLFDYTKEIERITKTYKTEENFNGIKITYVPNHYYYPIILSDSRQKIDYLNHIITEESEVKFIKELDEYLAKTDNLFDKRFDWWLFSKLDETTDEVYIPWYNPKTEKIERFKPDFIFWLCKGKEYYILFVDPKSITYTEYEHKVDWYKKIFEENGTPKVFPFQTYKIKIILSLYCDDKNRVSGGSYKKYWFDNIHKILEAI